MPISFTVDVYGAPELENALKRLGDGVIDVTSEFEASGEYLQDFEEKVFETEGQIFASPWAPLSESYDKWKHKKYPNRTILEATGNMRRGFKFSILDTNQALFHNDYDDEYLKYHQSNKPRTTKLPRRVIYKLDNERKNGIRSIFVEGLKTKLRKAFNG